MRAQASYTIVHVKDGNDLDGILMLWKKTTSNIAPSKPNGTNLNGWTEEMPEFESGAYVWTCNRVVISDPTAATPIYIYTDPVLDTHWQKLDEVYKQGTEIKNTVDNITLKYYNSNGAETSFKLINGAIDITLLKNQVDAAATTATNFISMRADGGIEVGNKSGGSWTGYRTQMLASEFNILNASGSKLASYGASEIGFYDGADNKIASFKPNEISLGMNNADAVISFCNNKGTFTYDADNGGLFMESKTWDIYAGDDSKYYSYVFVSPTAIELSAEYDAMAVNGYYTRMSMDTDSMQFSVYDRFMVNAQAIDLNALTVDSNGRLRRSTTGSLWYKGRDTAIYGSGNTLPNTSEYFALTDCKTQNGDWSIGALGDYLYFVFTNDSDYSAGNNTTSKFGIRNDGMPLLNGSTPLIEYGTWTPTIYNRSGSNPTVTYKNRSGYYYRIGNMVYVIAYISPVISANSGNYAAVSGLPFTSYGVRQGLEVFEGFNVFSHGNSTYHVTAHVISGTGDVHFYSPTGAASLNWIVNSGETTYNPNLRFSGWYRIA